MRRQWSSIPLWAGCVPPTRPGDLMTAKPKQDSAFPRPALPRTVGQEPVKAAKTLGMFRPPKSLNSARIWRMTPSMDYSENEESIDGVIRQIRALFNDSGGRNMLRVMSACTGFWPTVRHAIGIARQRSARQQRPTCAASPAQISPCWSWCMEPQRG